MSVDELKHIKELLNGALEDLRIVWEGIELTSEDCIRALESAIEKVYHVKLDLE